ncbi:glycosyltransferase family 4 protein [Aliarcobacter cryaerophilus]|uniref:glycosyltransferase family 4 protein n=1 Tax=Aliarcobacter cryaerophilus TaxID=28198 RepID=UPI0021B195A1|nr:glycosyltransferase family 4 protein [Aliarcobacter cryaerophilus]MCT7523335.1 glycosyltransferase family 4 protein [Aliarcobacter cryaerophilus]
MKKIVIAVNNSWYAWNMRANLGFALQKQGYEVIFICPYDKYSENIKVHFGYIDININLKGINPIEDLKTIYRYYKIYKEIKPDIVLQYTIKPNIYGTIAANMLNIPTINNIAGLGTLFIKQNFVTKIAKFLYKFSQKRATKIFFQNQDDFKMFVDEKLVQKEKCDVLPGSGVDIEKFTPIVKKENDGTFRFLLIGRIIKDKGVYEYVNAARILRKKYSNLEFELLGEIGVSNLTAIKQEQINDFVEEGIIKYLGKSDNVGEEIANVDCVVLPSYREGTPRTLLEAASMSKPIVTTDVPGCRDVVDDGINGFLCEVKNSDDLALKMEKMLNLSFDERNTMGKAGREKIVKEFDEKIVIEKYLKAIESILK